MAKHTAQKKSNVSVVVPGHVRSRLFPYAPVFEDVVVPLAVRAPSPRRSQGLKVELRESAEAALVAMTGSVPHPWLMRCGLMLCCYHALQGANGRNRAILVRAHELV